MHSIAGVPFLVNKVKVKSALRVLQALCRILFKDDSINHWND